MDFIEYVPSLRPYRYVPLFSRWGVLVLLGGVIFCFTGLLIGGVVFYRRRVARAIAKLPWNKAKKKLAELTVLLEKSEKDRGTFYIDLTCVVKLYLSERFGCSLLSKTDEELLAFLQGLSLEQSLVQGIHVLIDRSSQAKFGAEKIFLPQAKEDLLFVQKLVELTIPQEKDQSDVLKN